MFASLLLSNLSSPRSSHETNKELFKVSETQSPNCCFQGRKEKNADQSDGRLPLSYNRWSPHHAPCLSQHNSHFKYRILGVFPIDGDCERFLMCRSNEKTEKIKGKVYRCPKGDYLPAREREDHMLRFCFKNCRIFVLGLWSSVSTRGQRCLSPQQSSQSPPGAPSHPQQGKVLPYAMMSLSSDLL